MKKDLKEAKIIEQKKKWDKDVKNASISIYWEMWFRDEFFKRATIGKK
jgi:hypothetical protein